jgi:hypothetical protein
MTIATLFFAGILGSTPVESVPDPLFLKAVRGGFTTFSIISAAGIYFSYYRGQVNREINFRETPE